MLQYLKKLFIAFVNFTIHIRFLFTPKKKHNNFLQEGETIKYIIDHKCSICRYGDGEFDMIFKYLNQGETNSFFQKYDTRLAQKLYNILSYPQSKNNILICLPIYGYGMLTNTLVPSAKSFWEHYYLTHNKILNSVVISTETYGNAHFTRFYWEHKDKSKCANSINNIKALWENRNIVFIEGEFTRMGIGNKLFNNSISIKRIIAPATNAFNKYDKIIQTVISNVEKENLIILALGQTATALAYDLSLLGYQALDLGHLDIEYEWFCMKAKNKVPLANKYVNENNNGHINTQLEDPTYINQIIAYVK